MDIFIADRNSITYSKTVNVKRFHSVVKSCVKTTDYIYVYMVNVARFIKVGPI